MVTITTDHRHLKFTVGLKVAKYKISSRVKNVNCSSTGELESIHKISLQTLVYLFHLTFSRVVIKQYRKQSGNEPRKRQGSYDTEREIKTTKHHENM